MAKVIKYKHQSGDASAAAGNENILLDVTIGWNEANEEIAKREAYNGEYTVEDTEDDPSALSIEERLAALEKTLTVPEYAAGTWYYRGDRVRFEDTQYTCIAPEGAVCVWSPVDYPAYWQNNG